MPNYNRFHVNCYLKATCNILFYWVLEWFQNNNFKICSDTICIKEVTTLHAILYLSKELKNKINWLMYNISNDKYIVKFILSILSIQKNYTYVKANYLQK